MLFLYLYHYDSLKEKRALIHHVSMLPDKEHILFFLVYMFLLIIIPSSLILLLLPHRTTTSYYFLLRSSVWNLLKDLERL